MAHATLSLHVALRTIPKGTPRAAARPTASLSNGDHRDVRDVRDKIQRKIESFPGAAVTLHFVSCIGDPSEAEKVKDDNYSKQIDVTNKAFAEAKITFTRGNIPTCTDEERAWVAAACMPDTVNVPPS
eukprot:jgi/Picsp_1/2286/NSC_05750-R1_---NA---